MANKLSIAFIGTGIMGAPIAGHILDASYRHGQQPHQIQGGGAAAEHGAVWADTPAKTVANADRLYHGGLSPRRSRSSTWRATACSRAPSRARS